MEVKPAYKQTEIGLVPQDWGVQKLGELKPFLTSGSRGWASYYSERGDLFVRITNLTRESIYLDLTDTRFVRLPEGSSEGVRTQLEENDVLISITADIGIIGYIDVHVPVPAYINQHIALLRFDPAEVNSKFISYFLASEESQKVFRAVTDIGAKAGMSLSGVKKIQTALPPTINEQHAIATALNDMDVLLDGLNLLIAKKRVIKQAAMQELLTGQTRLPGFSGKWGRREIKALVVTPVTDGPHMTPNFHEDGVPFLSVNNLVNNIIDLKSLRYISKADDEVFSKKCKPRRGDILLGKAASVGKVAVVEDDFDFNIWSPIALIRVNELVVPKFIYYQLQGGDCVSQIMLLTNSSSQGNIGMSDIEKIEIPHPSVEEQAEIAAVLSDMDTEITALEARRSKTRALKQAMMQELLTGRTRLI